MDILSKYRYIQGLLARSDRIPWRHQKMTTEMRENFKNAVKECERKHPFFLWLKRSRFTMMTWVVIIALFGIFTFVHALMNKCSLLSILFSFILGIFSLQIIFVATHLRAHALFLEYSVHLPGHKRLLLIFLPVYYYAFYHHHHMEKDNPDNWAPLMSYYEHPNSGYPGTRNIATAHWHGYTMIGSWQLPYVLFCLGMCPLTGVFFFGHELGVVLLPAVHGWEHVYYKKMGILNPVFEFLEKVKIIAGPKDHEQHHEHDGPTVYKDFSSSGIYAKPIDEKINVLWNIGCYHAMNTGKKPFDVFRRPVDVVIWLCKVGLPLLIYCI